jgi:hypothetical protein
MGTDDNPANVIPMGPAIEVMDMENSLSDGGTWNVFNECLTLFRQT